MCFFSPPHHQDVLAIWAHDEGRTAEPHAKGNEEKHKLIF